MCRVINKRAYLFEQTQVFACLFTMIKENYYLYCKENGHWKVRFKKGLSYKKKNFQWGTFLMTMLKWLKYTQWSLM